MRAITIPRNGGPEVLEVRESADPTPAPGEVRVRVKAAGLNFAEVMARQGLYPDAPKLPCVVGYEAAGVIDALGEGVTTLHVGQRVVAMTKFGAHADVVCAPVVQVLPMPDAMGFEEGAAIPVNYLTAHHMLFRVACIRPGDSVLVHMAAGGVGLAALQLCKTVENITIFGTASASKHDALRAAGCHHPIDYRSVDYEKAVLDLTDGRGVHVVLDALGGDDWKKGYRLLRPAGRLVAFGFANMSSAGSRNLWRVATQVVQVPLWNPVSLMNDNKSVAGVNMGHLWKEMPMLREQMDELLRFWNEGKIKPTIDSVHPFDKAADAHRRLESRQNIGKVVLVP